MRCPSAGRLFPATFGCSRKLDSSSRSREARGGSTGSTTRVSRPFGYTSSESGARRRPGSGWPLKTRDSDAGNRPVAATDIVAAVNRSVVIAAYRVGFAVLTLLAIVVQFTDLAARGVLNPVNFFSYFTIQSNLIALRSS